MGSSPPRAILVTSSPMIRLPRWRRISGLSACSSREPASLGTAATSRMAAISSSTCLRSDDEVTHLPHESQKVSALGMGFAPSKISAASNLGTRGIKSLQAISASRSELQYRQRREAMRTLRGGRAACCTLEGYGPRASAQHLISVTPGHRGVLLMDEITRSSAGTRTKRCARPGEQAATTAD